MDDVEFKKMVEQATIKDAAGLMLCSVMGVGVFIAVVARSVAGGLRAIWAWLRSWGKADPFRWTILSFVVVVINNLDLPGPLVAAVSIVKPFIEGATFEEFRTSQIVFIVWVWWYCVIIQAVINGLKSPWED